MGKPPQCPPLAPRDRCCIKLSVSPARMSRAQCRENLIRTMESDLFQRMNSSQDSATLAARRFATVEARSESRPDRGLRFILLLGFGGLLALLLYSGANALNTLRDLHNAEEAARTRSLDRGRVLSTVILSTNSYSDHMEAYPAQRQSAPMSPTSTTMTPTRQAEAARQALQRYPVRSHRRRSRPARATPELHRRRRPRLPLRHRLERRRAPPSRPGNDRAAKSCRAARASSPSLKKSSCSTIRKPSPPNRPTSSNSAACKIISANF